MAGGYGRRRVLGAGAVGVAGLGATLGSACGTPGAPAGGTAGRGAPAVISTPTEILVWINDHGPEVQQWVQSDLLPKFKTEQPNVTVNIKWENWTGVAERLNAVFAAGSAPDVFTGGAEWAGSLAIKGQSRDISSYVKAWGEASDFVELRDGGDDDGRASTTASPSPAAPAPWSTAKTSSAPPGSIRTRAPPPGRSCWTSDGA